MLRKWMWTWPLLIVLLLSALASADLGTITPQLAEKMDRSDPDEVIQIYIIMKQQVDLSELRTTAKGMDKKQRRQLVVDRLTEQAQESQKGVLDVLEKAQDQGRAERIRSIPLGNTVACRATKKVIERLIGVSGIDYIQWDQRVKVIHETTAERRRRLLRKTSKTSARGGRDMPIFHIPLDEKGAARSSAKEIVWGLTKINADDVWALGYTGEGVIVGNLDTGVNYNHLDLQDHMWDGSEWGMPHHGYDFANSDNDPMDDHGHGTHTAGTIAGDGTAGSQTGVAPDAQIMVFKIWDDEGYGIQSDAWDAMWYGMGWGADILSMSGGWVHDSPITDLCAWREKCDELLAAGIIFSVAAGNGDDQGGHYPVPNDIGTPADVPAPWYPPPDPGDEHHSSIIAVGATTSSDIRCTFSSYGPTEWSVTDCPPHDYDDYNYPPGLMKPDVCAPGSYIKSLAYDDTAGYAGPGGWAGTSMSCPHVSGTLALMLEKNTDLTPVEMDSILETTAVDLGDAGRDNYYGAGRIDALAAVEATPEYGQPPEAVSDLSADLTTGSKTSGDIFLSWSEPNSDLGVDYYVVYRATDPEAAMDSLDATTDTVYTDPGAAGDTLLQHYYTVKAVDTGGQKSSESNKVGEFDRYLPTAP
jgi:serine protease AprX